MTTINVKERIQTLRNEILEHCRLYDEHRPVISDAEYDKLFQELVELEAAHPEFADSNSPTQRIVTAFVDALEQRRHRVPLISLDKAKEEDPKKVHALLKIATDERSAVAAQDKFDGLTISLLYDGGELGEGVTRGDGEVGEVVTHTVRTIKNLPKRISFKGRLELRAEAVIPFAEFERINEERLARGEETYSHPRNLAAGTLRQLDAKVAAERGLELYVYDITYVEEGQVSEEDKWMLDNYVGHLAFLEKEGFVVAQTDFYTGEKEFQMLIDRLPEYEARRRALPYAVDGLVFKLTNLRLREELGTTGHHPKWAVAYKFKAQFQHTVLRDVLLQLGRTGIVAPVAVFDEIDLDGALTTRATLHNFEFIRKLDLRIGDTIVVARANDVIPRVMGIVEGTERGHTPVVPPTDCPSCGHKVIFEGAYLKCVNPGCEPVFIRMVEHVGSRDALDIEGLGESVAELLVKGHYVSDIADVFYLAQFANQLKAEEGFGARKVTKLLDAIDAAKTKSFDRVLYSLGVPFLGRTLSKLVSAHFGSIDAVINASYDDLLVIEGLGDAAATSITQWFSSPENLELVDKLRTAGLTMEAEKKVLAGDALAGKTVVITGTLSKSRSHFEQLVEAHGGKCSGSVSKKTSYVLAGVEAGSKLEKAQSLGVTVLDEESFLALIGA